VVDQLLGFGTRNKYTLGHRELHIAKLGLAQDILHGATSTQLLDYVLDILHHTLILIVRDEL
jgi:hypothetical protein